MTNWHEFNFLIPIKESVDSTSGEFLIQGVAINETVTKNGTKFIAAELEKGVASLRNKPIMKDHDNSVDSIVGRTTENVVFNSKDKRIDFEGRIADPVIQQKIHDGLITAVSVGAFLDDVREVKDDGGNVIAQEAIGIEFVELSLVAVPADPNAGFAMAIAESYNKKRQFEAAITGGNLSIGTTTWASDSTISPTNKITFKIKEDGTMTDEKNKLELLREDNRAIFTAASKASQAADFLIHYRDGDTREGRRAVAVGSEEGVRGHAAAD